MLEIYRVSKKGRPVNETSITQMKGVVLDTGTEHRGSTVGKTGVPTAGRGHQSGVNGGRGQQQ